MHFLLFRHCTLLISETGSLRKNLVWREYLSKHDRILLEYDLHRLFSLQK